jgi:hypothetical protein
MSTLDKVGLKYYLVEPELDFYQDITPCDDLVLEMWNLLYDHGLQVHVPTYGRDRRQAHRLVQLARDE